MIGEENITIQKILLASSSPRRAELLERMGIVFDILTPDADENFDVAQRPEEVVRMLASRKAHAAKHIAPLDHQPILAADTIVCIEGEILGKPKTQGDAKRMLYQLSGRWHDVFTGVCMLRCDGYEESMVSQTHVHVVPITPIEVESYIASGEPMDKAGAYAIQGRGGSFIDRIEGSPSNVIGLPMAQTRSLIERFLHLEKEA